MNAHSLLRLLMFLAKRPYSLVINPRDYTGKLLKVAAPSSFDVNTHAETLRRGFIGIISVGEDFERRSSVYVCRHVPEDVVVRLYANRIQGNPNDTSELQLLRKTWPDIPDDLLPLVFPKLRQPLPSKSKILLAELVDAPKYVHRRVIALKPLLERKLIERVGPSSYIATAKGRLVAGKYRMAWSMLDGV